jgi:hypothetical protein
LTLPTLRESLGRMKLTQEEYKEYVTALATIAKAILEAIEETAKKPPAKTLKDIVYDGVKDGSLGTNKEAKALLYRLLKADLDAEAKKAKSGKSPAKVKRVEGKKKAK